MLTFSELFEYFWSSRSQSSRDLKAAAAFRPALDYTFSSSLYKNCSHSIGILFKKAANNEKMTTTLPYLFHCRVKTILIFEENL